jgi:hypothetical protein
MDAGVLVTLRPVICEELSPRLLKNCANPDIELKRFLKILQYLPCYKSVAKTWAQDTQTCMESVWKNLCQQLVPDFRGFSVVKIFEEVSEKVVKLVKQLQLEMKEQDVEELTASHEEVLTSKSKVK